MNKTKTKDKAKTEAPATRAAGASERYERRDDGFYLVKTLRSGETSETRLSNFVAEIWVERHREHEYLSGTKRTWIEGYEVSARFKDLRETFIIPAGESLIDAALKIHPLARVYPGKEKHVETAIIELSDWITGIKRTSDKQTQSAPQSEDNGADSKMNKGNNQLKN